MRFKALFAIAFAVLITGCASPGRHELLNVSSFPANPADISAEHDIFVATTRRQSADQPRIVYGGDRSPNIAYASVDITVPKIHETGRIERARGRAQADPAKHFTARRVSFFKERQQFAQAINADVVRHEGQRVLVFVHGFNNGFDDGVYRITQIVHDTKYVGTPVLFSWASAAKTTGYLYDKESANAARDDLEATLRMLAGSKAKSIDIIAHSMGTWVTMETLRQLAITGDRDLGGKLGNVILASPDIDVDVFKKQMERYGKPDKPFVILLSDDDRALRLSTFISGDKPRVGDYSDAADLASLGVTVADLTQASSGDRLNHAKFADNPFLVELLGEGLRMNAGLSAAESGDFGSPMSTIGKDIGQAVGSVADIVITTPFRVLSIATGG